MKCHGELDMNSKTGNEELTVKPTFPKESAFHVGFKEYGQAVKWVTGKRKYGGCFEEVSEGYITYWLTKDHPRLSEFAW